MARTTIEPHPQSGLPAHDGESAPRYPRRLLRRVAEQTGFSYRLSALDLSNDGGELAVELARMARTITVALDDEQAFAHASATVLQHHARVQLRVSSLPDLAAEGARYWLVTIGRSLPAGAGDALLEVLDPLLDRGGSVVLLGVRYPQVQENAWRALVPHTVSDPERDQVVLLRSRFDHVERISVFERRAATLEGALEEFAEPERASLREQLYPHVDRDGRLHSLLEGHALIARREGDRSGRWS